MLTRKRGYNRVARFTPHTEDDVREMLEAIGVESLDDLFADVSPKLEGELDLPPVLSEYEALSEVNRLAAKNVAGVPIFLGAGAYDRIIPSAVGAIISRGEFLTSYTPYQPEISQGVLQTIFEYQSVISELTGLEISNASVYDGASAVAEAALMTARQTKRDPKVAVSAGLNPRYCEVIETYRVETVELSQDNGTTDFSGVPEEVSGVFVQSPNYYGIVEDVGAAAEAANQPADYATPSNLDGRITSATGRPIRRGGPLGGTARDR